MSPAHTAYMTAEPAPSWWNITLKYIQFAYIAALLCLLCACATLKTAATGAEDDNLDDPRFSALDIETKTYLKNIAAAWRRGDAAFLLSQGESRYQSEKRFGISEARYLALLYRAGPYADDNEWTSAAYDLAPDAVLSLRFLDFHDEGPVRIFDCRFTLKSGDRIPAKICLLWRLPSMKILGER